ncbi:hypothetical protein NLI96_g8304 [Meripilus lineatus]|uniref:Uncharacterized protein n=1 Tax=Meripilus lineatus TaxID=2056292 RepID=A0AAD5UXK6_9APHY|nr:hypothetical protein NLI96_g8304 [Physisporinus lineatus]
MLYKCNLVCMRRTNWGQVPTFSGFPRSGVSERLPSFALRPRCHFMHQKEGSMPLNCLDPTLLIGNLLVDRIVAFSKMCHAVAGVYFWDYAMSLDFEWGFITRKRRFRWPMLFYFLSRYVMLISIIGQLIALDITTEVNCGTLYTFNAATALASIGLASINLAIRTMVIWGYKYTIVIPLVATNLAFWGMTVAASKVDAVWLEGQGCFVAKFDNHLVSAAFIFTMCFDLAVLGLAAGKLAFGPGKRTRLMNLMFQDGIIFFIIVAVANIPATTMMLLALNPILTSMLDLPLATISTMVACRAVRRLSQFSNAEPEIIGIPTNPPPSSQVSNSILGPKSTTQHHMSQKSMDGVHIQMETFQVADADSESDVSKKQKFPRNLV